MVIIKLTKIFGWFNSFKSGIEIEVDDPRLCTSKKNVKIEKLHKIIQQNHLLTIQAYAEFTYSNK